MTDGVVVALAVSALAGAWWSYPLRASVVAAVGLVGLALARRAPGAVVVVAFVAASFLGARSWQGLRSAPTSGPYSGRAAVVADPTRSFGGVQLELRLDDGRRVRADAAGDAGVLLGSRLAGESVEVAGTLRPLSASSRAYLSRRHVGARLRVSAVSDLRPGNPVARLANEVRRTLSAGTDSMERSQRALFTGLVLGDDRDQSPEDVADFRAAGLTHLLAVSGQNVVFVLAVAAPLLRRMAFRPRLVVGAVVLFAFGVLTRWEPSVLRAVAMAGVTMVAATVGRPTSSLRTLALAVTALVFVDPLLAGSVGFLLSVGACAGIAVVGPRLARRGVPQSLAVTAAAQVGVAPVLIPVFGGLPLASLPANLLAGPAAGPVMMWGLVGGLPAGLVGGPVAWLLHLPTRALLWWIDAVAAWAAALPLPYVDGRRAVVLVVACGAGVAVERLVPQGRAVRVVVAALVTGLVFFFAVSLSPDRPDDTGAVMATGAVLWRVDGASVLVAAGNADAGRVLDALRVRGVRRVDLLVLRSPGTSSARLASTLDRRLDVGVVVAPEGHRVPGATAVRPGQHLRAGPIEVAIVGAGPPMIVRVGSPGHAPRARVTSP